MAERGFYDSDYGGTSGREDLKLESPTSPIEREKIVVSRCNSTGSLNTLSSSTHNTDDDDDEDSPSNMTYKDRRREAHTQAEQKRRDAIKRGYDNLHDIVPMCQHQDSISGYKMSKATVLQKSIDYIQFLLQQKKKQEDELTAYRKEVIALQIMKVNYEQIVKQQQSQPGKTEPQISDEIKFHVFGAIIDTLFRSFDDSVSVANFSELSGSVFSWLEEQCKPQMMRALIMSILQQLDSQLS